jgi:spore germination cell wall hydrolase CwlJ-like protein
MNWFSMLALCASANTPVSIDCDSVYQTYAQELSRLHLNATDIDAITRTAYAEAENQGSLGLSGVVFTILNRKVSGQFSSSIEEIINRANQFEPVTNAGGWKNLPIPTLEQKVRIETIIELAQSGYMPDPTGGALYFQNAQMVAERVAQASVSSHLKHFGNSPISATIDDHTFYAIMCLSQEETSRSNDNITPLRLLKNTINTNNGVKQLRGSVHSNQ